MLNAEMDVHLEQADEAHAGNHRNGSSSKTVLMPEGPMELSIPRDRHGRFDPVLIAKYRRRFPGFDDKIIALYARGMSTRDIQGHVRELHGTEISPDLVSAVTDQVIEEVTAWQGRPLEASYAIVFFDAMRVKICDEGLVRNKAVYLAIGMDAARLKHVLELGIEQSEWAKFWLRVKYRWHMRVDEKIKAKNRTKSRVRAKVEHTIGVIKRIFGFQKVRYRGLAKNLHRPEVTAALANLYLVRRPC